MKYLIQNKKEFAITVAAFVMAVVNLVKAILSKDVTEDLIVAVLVTASTVLAWYYNMPTSEANCKYTGLMRLEKAQLNAEMMDGENFYDDPDEPLDEESEGVDEDEDEEITEEGDE